MPEKTTSCGVIVTDGWRMLLGHATRSPRWDIPKGGIEPGEDFIDAATRELHEETGLFAPPDALRPLGVFPYLRAKNLALFIWRVAELPDPKTLYCSGPVAGQTCPSSIASVCSRERRRWNGSARTWLGFWPRFRSPR